ncbi:perlucin-like [Centropristis striata]|uniref:perlucin-like n=1 Tax=Centropristis striata TaxID=184440 RepID=UPI0027E1440D|nr:perlucin-like [Centropristis striata]
MEHVEFLNSLAATAGFSSNTWIGLYEGSWSWSLSDTSFYGPGEEEFRRWDSQQPDNSGGDKHCTKMKHNGKWDDASCTENIRAVCCDVRGENIAE